MTVKEAFNINTKTLIFGDQNQIESIRIMNLYTKYRELILDMDAQVLFAVIDELEFLTHKVLYDKGD